MRKSFIFPAVCLAFFLIPAGVSAASALGLVREIKISGLKHAKESAVREKISLKRKKPFSQEEVNSDIREILSLGYFDDVSVGKETMPDGLRIIYSVKEKPWLTRIDIKGNTVYKEKKLLSVGELKEGDFFSRTKIEEGKNKIREHYVNNAYADIQLDAFPEIDAGKNEATCDIYIIEGNKILIKRITVSGAAYYKPKKVLKEMETRIKKPFKDDVFRQDLEKITALYKNSGFLDFEIKDHKVAYNAERTEIDVDIAISEGMRYQFGNMSFTGNAVYSADELSRALGLKKGSVYSEELFRQALANVYDIYSDKGYIKVQIVPDLIRRQDGFMDAVFAVTENEVFYIGDVVIEGNEVTRDYVIKRELLLKRGDPFSVSRVRRTNEILFNLGFFEDVKIDFSESRAEKNTVDLTFLVSEQRTGMASMGAGYSNQDGLVGTLQLSQQNLFGKGQKLNLMWEFGEKKQSYSIGFTEPWFLNTRTSLGVDIYDLLRKRDYIYQVTDAAGTRDVTDGYDEERQGGGIRVGRPFRKYLNLSFNYSLERIRISSVNDDNDVLKTDEQKSWQTTSSLTSALSRDTRDNIFDASSGSRQSISCQTAGGPFGGDNNFIKTIFTYNKFFPTFWKLVLGLNFQAGMVENYSFSQTVPVYERFYVGGAESVRGYEYRGQIGPLGGGKYYIFYNAEYKFPIAEEKGRTILQGAFFADVGGAWDEPDDVNLEIGSSQLHMKAGVGFGIRFKTPVFPIRLDWGYGFNHSAGEEKTKWYFTIGQIF